MADVELTLEEQKAISSMQRLAKKWPTSLKLFSWNGSLTVFKEGNDETCVVGHISGIRNDGGDPDEGINQEPEIAYLDE